MGIFSQPPDPIAGVQAREAFPAISLLWLLIICSMNPASHVVKTTMFQSLKLPADCSAPNMENVSRGRSPFIGLPGIVNVCKAFEHLGVVFVNDSETLCALSVLNDASSKFDMLKA